MTFWQARVRDFLKALDKPTAPAEPMIRDGHRRARLILEEAFETAFALVGYKANALAIEVLAVVRFKLRRKSGKPSPIKPDLVGAIDGLCDLIYVVLGTAEALGVELEPHFAAVHAANMRKVSDPQFDEHGKVIKPVGWIGPEAEIEATLEVQRGL